jgi:hypothetical protein
VEVRVIDCVAGEFNATLPKAMFVALTLSVATAAFNCRAKVWETPSAFAVSVAVCAVETAEEVAVKLALVAPAATVTDAGTVTAELLLAKATVNPPAAAAFRVTVQASVCAPVMEEVAQETAVSTGTPVPLKAIVDVGLAEELLLMIRDPAIAPAAEGSNCTAIVAV